jgi:two-component system chemotaxis response regulator CheB
MVEKVRVLIVDDSSFFRQRIRQELSTSAAIEICGEAANGQEAVDLCARLHPDVITMDVAMPLMDGIAAVRAIMRDHPTRIIMFSALTTEGARATLDALEAGAVDFLAKQDGIQAERGNGDSCRLCDRVIQIARGSRQRPTARKVAAHPAPLAARPAGPRPVPRPRLVVIGASTGGPVALQNILAALPAGYPYPVLVAVHMPAEFTATFAERLDRICQVKVGLAADGDPLLPGQVLIAPGGMQTLVGLRDSRMRVQLAPAGDQLYKPSIDLLFGSVARALGDAALGVILTGMGADGTQGAGQLKAGGATIWSQDRDSSVVYGMPHSVAKAGFTDRVLALDDMGAALAGLA